MVEDVTLTHEALNNGKLRYKHLLGKTFVHGKDDCYEMLRRMYKDNLNIELTNYARANGWWLDPEANLYVKNFKQEGFSVVDEPELEDLRPFDVFLIALPDHRAPDQTSTNHCAIYLGNGLIIHHRLDRFSQVTSYRGPLRNYTTHVIRHKAVPDMRQKGQNSIDLMDVILPHKREMLMAVMNDKADE